MQKILYSARVSAVSALLAAFLTIAIPALLLQAAAVEQSVGQTEASPEAAEAATSGETAEDEATGEVVEAAASQDAPAPAEDTAASSLDEAVTVTLLTDDGAISLPLDEYLLGVVLAEVPAGFETEAIQAQAVAARTFTLRQMAAEKHDGGALCSDSGCCQAWCSPDRAAEKLGENSDVLLDKLRQAVADTDGQVLCYDGALIDATYFSCSGGRTEDAVAVWGTDVPYLQSVDSPGEEDAPRYTETVCVTLEAFQDALADFGCDLSGAPVGWFGPLTETTGGGVDTLEIGGVCFTGVELRQLFSLRSTCFTVAVTAEGIAFTTLGYGHRVGLSQYGANAMALAGCGYEEILLHYYSGVSLVTMDTITQ